MSKIRMHIEMSQKVTKCKNCKTLKMVRYFNDYFCQSCDKEYNILLNKVINS